MTLNGSGTLVAVAVNLHATVDGLLSLSSLKGSPSLPYGCDTWSLLGTSHSDYPDRVININNNGINTFPGPPSNPIEHIFG